MSLESQPSQEESMRSFSFVVFPKLIEEAKNNKDYLDEREGPVQGIVRMTLDYISAGLMDWETATIFISNIFDLENDNLIAN